jgi:hypothetical protein
VAVRRRHDRSRIAIRGKSRRDGTTLWARVLRQRGYIATFIEPHSVICDQEAQKPFTAA